MANILASLYNSLIRGGFSNARSLLVMSCVIDFLLVNSGRTLSYLRLCFLLTLSRLQLPVKSGLSFCHMWTAIKKLEDEKSMKLTVNDPF